MKEGGSEYAPFYLRNYPLEEEEIIPLIDNLVCASLSDTSAVLKKHKDKLLGLFLSLLVNHNPLHRSSGVAGLVAMVSSALLADQEVTSITRCLSSRLSL